MNMAHHSTSVEWRYVVPPRNDVRICIMKRTDGPFRMDTIGGDGHYYVSVEVMVRGVWQHEAGSTQGGFRTFEEAYGAAVLRWAKELEQ